MDGVKGYLQYLAILDLGNFKRFKINMRLQRLGLIMNTIIRLARDIKKLCDTPFDGRLR